LNTRLKNRTLWFDGDISVEPSNIYDHIKYVGKLYAEKIDEDIIQYNSLVPKSEKLNIKKNISDINPKWNIPEKYKRIKVFKYILSKLNSVREEDELNDDEYNARFERVYIEYAEFKRLNMQPMLLSIIYIINTFEDNKIVWGPGRGSSASSYILYLLKLHDVDSVLYDIDISDFLKDIE
jgi:DNA polymerase III alpha subunit